MANEDDKLKLFDSGEEEEEEDDDDDDFRIQPQYQGPHGQKILELNAELPERFKLDERFAETSESDNDIEHADDENLAGGNEEKNKNIRILETVLGHGINKKPTNKSLKRKKLMRYDPEDENASKFIKISENTNEKPKDSKKKKEKAEQKSEDILPISTERYTEVCSNLKEVLSSSTAFSFSQMFSHDVEKVPENSLDEITSEITKDAEIQHLEKQNKKKFRTASEPESSVQFPVPKSKLNSFFILEGDPRLKEGIEFFKRPKSLDEIRVEWQSRREHVSELFKRKRRSLYKPRTGIVHEQMKYRIRNQNFRK